MQDERLILDYSSPAQEANHRPDDEAEQWEAVKRYNQLAFDGGRRLFAYLGRSALQMAIVVTLCLVLPNKAACVLVPCVVIAFIIWEWRIDHWPFFRE